MHYTANGSKGAVFAVVKSLVFLLVERLLAFLMFLYYFCLPFSARILFFIATSPSELFLTQMKFFYLESIITILNGSNYTKPTL